MRHLLIKERAGRARPGTEVQAGYGQVRGGKAEAAAVSWNTAFRLRQFARGSLWVLPLAGGLLGALLGSGLILADQSVHLPSYWTYSPSTASTVLSAIVGAMAALTGFVVTVTVLVVQMATGMFSARYLRLWYRDRVLKLLLALLVGTLAAYLVRAAAAGREPVCPQPRRDGRRGAGRGQLAAVRGLPGPLLAPAAARRGSGAGGQLREP